MVLGRGFLDDRLRVDADRLQRVHIQAGESRPAAGTHAERQRHLAVDDGLEIGRHLASPYDTRAACHMACATCGPSISECAPDAPSFLAMNWLLSRLVMVPGLKSYSPSASSIGRSITP